MILDRLIEKLNDDTTHLAELRIVEKVGNCRTRSAIYEDESKIGCVCNWNKR